MKKITTPILTALLLFVAINAGNAREVVNDFKRVEIRGSVIVYVKQGKEIGTKAEQKEGEKLSNYSVTQKGDLLIIDSDENDPSEKPAVINLTVDELKKLTMSGSGSVTFLSEINLTNLEIVNSGSGNIQGTVEVKNLAVKITGSGNIDLKGNVKTSNVKISGSGCLNAINLKIADCTFTSTGSGSATIDISQNLNAKFTGSGNLNVPEFPGQVYSKSDGSGDLVLIKS